MPVESRQTQCAGFVSRATAFIVDVILLLLLSAGVEGVVEAIDSFFRGSRSHVPALLSAMIPLLVPVYFVLFWTLAGQTPGKWLLGLRVVGPDGEPPSFGRSLVRFFGYFLSSLPLYLGFVLILFDRQRRSLHDRLAGTFVVYAGPVGKLSLPAKWRDRRDIPVQ